MTHSTSSCCKTVQKSIKTLLLKKSRTKIPNSIYYALALVDRNFNEKAQNFAIISNTYRIVLSSKSNTVNFYVTR